MLRIECSAVFQNCWFPCLPAIGIDIHCLFFCRIPREDLVELLEVKLTKVCGSPHGWVAQEFLLTVVHTEAPATSQLQLRLCNPGTVRIFCSSKLSFSVSVTAIFGGVIHVVMVPF